MATEPTPPPDLAARFQPDYTPEQLEQLGVYDSLYRGQGPRLASLGAWKPEWVSEHDPKGWAQWYKRYASGRRIPEEDDRQIKRWLNLKSRHGGPFVTKPSPRRGWALRNWAIDPAKLVAAENQPAVTTMLDDYQRKAMQKHVAKMLPTPEKAAELLPEVQLQPHQQRIADRVTQGSPRMLVYHGLGSGKSLSALAAAEAANGQFGDNYGIVAPAALKGNFEKEVSKFTSSHPEILSYTGLGMGKQFTEQPDTLIMDEAHRLRNPGGAASHAASEQARQAKNLLLLTGSPITNDPSDLANLIGLIDNKLISPEGFRKKFVGTRTVNPGLYGWFRGAKPGEREMLQNEPELRKLLRGKVDYQASKNPKGVNVSEETINVPLSPAQQKIQKAVRTKIPPGFLWKMDQEFPLSRDELGKLNSFLTGLRQVSISTRPFRADKDPMKAFEQSAKLQKAMANLKGVLESDPRKKAIIYSNHIDAGLAPYAAALDKSKIPHALFHGSISPAERQRAVQEYNAGKLRALLIGPAGAEGLSTRGTSLIQLLDPHWHESRSQQARGRGLRFDSHEGLPEELKNVDVQRYISSSEDPSWVGKLMGYTRERTGDEVLEHLAKEKEMLNEQFRKVLQDEGRVTGAVLQGWRKVAAGPIANAISIPTDKLVENIQQFPNLLFQDEPGFANTFSNPWLKNLAWHESALLPLGIAGAGLAALSVNEVRKRRANSKKPVEKAADWRAQLAEAKSQLPGLHPVDTTLGALGGAALGGVYDAVRGNSARLPNDKRWRSTARRVLGGALAGGAGANLVGDRARRYISNTLVPFGYDNERLNDVKPDSFKKVWNAAVLDRPSYDPAAVEEVLGYRPTGLLAARREIMRRSFGVHSNNAAKDWWQKNPSGHYSMNEKHPEYLDRLRLVFGPRDDSKGKDLLTRLTKDPIRTLETINTKMPEAGNSQSDEVDFFSAKQISGSQQVPFAVNGPRVDVQALDRFDLTPSKKEMSHLRHWLKNKLFSRNSNWGSLKPGSAGFDYAEDGRTNDQLGKTIGARWLWDNVLSDELPWVSQKMTLQHNGGDAAAAQPWSLQFLRDNGAPADAALNTPEAIDRWINKDPLSRYPRNQDPVL